MHNNIDLFCIVLYNDKGDLFVKSATNKNKKKTLKNQQNQAEWIVPHFVIKMYKSPPCIVLLPFSIHSWVNCSQACSQTKKHMFFCVK